MHGTAVTGAGTAGRLGVKIVSGGQTGVDRAALDAAMEAGLAVGGWCPKGRRAEDGPIAQGYPLKETPSRAYAQRTEWNVRDSDATLILHGGELGPGTRLTAELARRHRKPLLMVDLGSDPSPDGVWAWVRGRGAARLNVAGPREDASPGIYTLARDFLTRLLAHADRCGQADP